MRLCMVFLFGIFVIPSVAFATLMQFESGGAWLVRDTSTGEVWISDMEQFSTKSYEDVGNYIEGLNQNSYGGISSWELASLWQVKDLFASVNDVDDAALFGITYDSGYDYDEYGSWGITSTINKYNGNYYAPWLARYPDYPDELDVGLGAWKWSSDGTPHPDIGAWVKTTEFAVPEPMSIVLLGFGMLAIATFRRQVWRT